MNPQIPHFVAIAAFTAGLCFTGACQSRAWNEPDSGVEQFKPLEYREGEARRTGMTLRHAGDTPHEVYVREIDLRKVDGEKDIANKERFQNHIDVRFGKIASKERFDSLMRTYGGRPSHPFDPEREYHLVDFLPPAIQATVGKRFRTHEERVEGVSGILTRNGNVMTMGNCWTTVYEVMRADPEAFTLFYVGDFQADEALTSPAHSREIKVVSSEMFHPEKGAAARNEGLRPFDVLLVYKPVDNFKPDGPKKLVHAAVYLDDDLYFEKSGLESLYPYRIGSYRDIVTQYSAGGILGNYRYVVRRFDTGRPLRSPIEAFGLSKEQWAAKGVEGVSEAELSKMLFSRERIKGEAFIEEVQLAHEIPYVANGEKRLWDLDGGSFMYDYFKLRP